MVITKENILIYSRKRQGTATQVEKKIIKISFAAILMELPSASERKEMLMKY